MALILDTNAVSAFADGDEKLLRAIEPERDIAVPAIVLGEYLFGIHQSRFRIRYEQWLNTNLPLFDLLSIGAGTARHYAEIRHELKLAGRPIPSNDLWIAALAREHRMPVLSRDVHFEAVRGLTACSW
ncbi:MAG: type II toxin-antitoxin system VapC family toxin [Acidobacteriota bacterium]|nr:type II toxin-antitoxin system VapC family toxin [Acidobacteriota bacterium]